MNNKTQLDSYSILICSKYFETKQDFINIICVCKKFKETTEKLRYNPISINTLKLFPKIQTQYLYDKEENIMNNVKQHRITYTVDFEEFMKTKDRNFDYCNVEYTKGNTKQYGFSIPSCINSLSERCFSKRDITSIIIPNSVKTIENECFYHCSQLQNITFSNTLTKIGNLCFCDCTNLKSIHIPSSLDNLDCQLFVHCYSLSKVVLPATITSIGDFCFSSCPSLRSIQLPSSLQYIGKNCFHSCGIESIEIPETIKYIGFGCFLDCTSLTSIKLYPNGFNLNMKVSYLDLLFYKQFNIQCRNVVLTKGDVDNFNYNFLNKNIYDGTLTIPNDINSINYYCLSVSNYIQSIVVPTTVTSIGYYCFKNCSFLTSLSIPQTVKNIGIGFLHNCTKLINLSLPLNDNNKYPFKVSYTDYLTLKKKCGYVYLQSITIPTTVKHIGKHLIDGCINLIEFKYDGDWDNIVVSYDDHLRYKSIGLVFNSIEYTNDDKIKYRINIPSIVHSLNHTFYNRSNDMFYIPSHITSLGKMMFTSYDSEYSKLRSIVIPISIKTIPKYCFHSCMLLTNKAFSNCISLKTIIIPKHVISIEKYAFEECFSLTSITLPESIPTLGENALGDVIN
ncbi:hypothetical protein QTN25_003656 [Entamoeba marina]